MSFQTTLMSTALIVFIIVMIILAIMLFNARNSKVWPPTVSPCPDFWLAESSKKEGQCKGLAKNASCDIGATDVTKKCCDGLTCKGISGDSSVTQCQPNSKEGFESGLITKCSANMNLKDPKKGNWGTYCKKKDGKYTCDSMDFGVAPYNSQNPITAVSAKCYWAKQNGILWSGVTDVGSTCNTKPSSTNKK